MNGKTQGTSLPQVFTEVQGEACPDPVAAVWPRVSSRRAGRGGNIVEIGFGLSLLGLAVEQLQKFSWGLGVYISFGSGMWDYELWMIAVGAGFG